METFQPLVHFYEASEGDARIGPAHISLYMALLREWHRRSFETPLAISRDELMQAARISRKTYNKCMKELQAYGYITYQPSFNPFVQSRVYMGPGH